jgi:hypothetical protein
MRWRIPCLAATFLTVMSMPAYAYLDPGTGSIIAQAIIGALVAASVFAKVWWERVTKFLGLGKVRDDARPDAHG